VLPSIKVLVIVEKVQVDDSYRVVVANRSGVPMYTPNLPDPPIVSFDTVGAQCILTKCINAYRVSLLVPEFQDKPRTKMKDLFSNLASVAYKKK